MLQALQLVQPTTVSEAVEALTDLGDKARIYAGGAELLLLLRNGLLQSEVLIDIKKIERLHQIQYHDGALRIGACVTHHALANNPVLREHAPALAYAESHLANVRVRNQGTLGGNLAFSDPHSDPGTVLLLHNAAVIIGGPTGERAMALADFLIDMYETALTTRDLLIEIELPDLPRGMTSMYQRLHRYQRPTLGIAVAARMSDGVIAESRLVVGCAGPKPERLTELESKIAGAKPIDAVRILRKEKNYLRELLRPVDDFLGSAEYKLYMACTMLSDAVESVTQSSPDSEHPNPVQGSAAQNL